MVLFRITGLIMAIVGTLLSITGIVVYSVTKQTTGIQKKLEFADVSIAGGMLLLFGAILVVIIHSVQAETPDEAAGLGVAPTAV